MNEWTEFFLYIKEVNVWSVLLRVFLALIIGGTIGMDRGRHGRAAGARTHILVCLGATVTTLVGFYTASSLGFSNDPLRMGAQVVSGIGFLGVGTIMIRNHSHVKGLTTAAGLWTTACIGLALGAGFYTLALLSFSAVLLTFTLLSRLEQRLRLRDHGAYYIEFPDIRAAKNFYCQRKEEISGVELVAAKSGLPEHVGMELVVENPKLRDEIFGDLLQMEEISIALPHHM